MKLFVKSIFLLLAICSAIALANEDRHGIDREVEKKFSIAAREALSKSIEKMLDIGLAVSDRKIVVSNHGKLIVVSFLPVDSKVIGGRMHHVYDKKSDSIVYVLGGD